MSSVLRVSTPEDRAHTEASFDLVSPCLQISNRVDQVVDTIRNRGPRRLGSPGPRGTARELAGEGEGNHQASHPPHRDVMGPAHKTPGYIHPRDSHPCSLASGSEYSIARGPLRTQPSEARAECRPRSPPAPRAGTLPSARPARKGGCPHHRGRETLIGYSGVQRGTRPGVQGAPASSIASSRAVRSVSTSAVSFGRNTANISAAMA